MKSMEKVMQKWKSYGKHFQQNRLYMGILLLTAVCAYGYKVTNATIGIDDTPSLYYFEEGLIAIVGRWVLFLLNNLREGGIAGRVCSLRDGFCGSCDTGAGSGRLVCIVLFCIGREGSDGRLCFLRCCLSLQSPDQ